MSTSHTFPLPFMAPDHRYWATENKASVENWQLLGENMHISFGLLASLDKSGVAKILKTLESRILKSVKFRFIIVVYAAGELKAEDFKKLLSAQEKFRPHVEFRLQPLHLLDMRPMNIIWGAESKTEEGFLAIGSNCCFNDPEEMEYNHFNFVYQPTVEVRNSFTNWFNWLWEKSFLLTPQTSHVPLLVMPEGNEAGKQAWDRYLADLEASKDEIRPNLFTPPIPKTETKVDPVSGEVDVIDRESGEPVEKVTESIGVPPSDVVAGRIARLFTEGQVVTINKETRLPPFDMSVKPEWFGMQSIESIGEIKFNRTGRISVFSENDLKQLEAERKRISSLLEVVTFRIADGTRWMPNSVREIFVAEIESLNAKGVNLLKAIVAGNPEEFVNSKRNKVFEDVKAVLMKNAVPENKLAEMSNLATETILQEFTPRLQSWSGQNFVPSVSFTTIQFNPVGQNSYTDPWHTAVNLIYEIIKFPRANADDQFFLRGLGIKRENLLNAMNVLEDPYLKNNLLPKGRWEIGKSQIAEIDKLRERQPDSKSICAALLNYLDQST